MVGKLDPGRKRHLGVPATVVVAMAIVFGLMHVKHVSAQANPNFEVATIKPSKPDAMGKGFGARGRQFKTFN